MSDLKERAAEVFQTFGAKVKSGEATGEDFTEFRQGLRAVAEEAGLDLSGYDERISPVLDEVAENFDLDVFKQQLRTIVERITEYFEIDPESLRDAAE